MHTCHSAVDGLLHDSFVALQLAQRLAQVVLDFDVEQMGEILVLIVLQILDFLLVGHAHVWREVEVERRNCLTTVHLVLRRFERNAGLHRSCLDALCRTALGVCGLQSVLQDGVERMLHAGERLGRIVVLVVDVDVAVADSIAHLGAQKVIIDERLSRFAGELHHHAGRSVGVHVGILARDVVVLHTDDGVENLLGLGLAGHATCISVRDVLAGDLLAVGLHQGNLDGILDVFDLHVRFALLGNAVGNGGSQNGINALFGGGHGLTDSVLDLAEVEIDGAAIALDYFLNHKIRILVLVFIFSYVYVKLRFSDYFSEDGCKNTNLNRALQLHFFYLCIDKNQ